MAKWQHKRPLGDVWLSKDSCKPADFHWACRFSDGSRCPPKLTAISRQSQQHRHGLWSGLCRRACSAGYGRGPL
jgi:hypothetical protein